MRHPIRLRLVALAIPALILVGSIAIGAQGVDRSMLDRSVLDDPTRTETSRAQDEGRKALEVYEWLGIEPGMTVADLWPGSGYNTHLLSRLMGDSGTVVTVWQFFAREDVFDGRIFFINDFRQHALNAGLDNVEIFEDFPEVASGSIDVAIAVRNYHDIEWTFEDYKRTETIAAIYRIMKPGGIVGVVDVATPTEGFDTAAHRLNQQVIIDDFEAGGFELVGTSDLLANPDDDHAQPGFPNRHLSDRYLLKFRKPAM